MRREELLDDQEEADILHDQSLQSKIWTCMPGIVQSVDYQKFTVSVQPAIQGRIEDENGEEQYVDLPLLVDVPLVFPRGGKWHITTPIVPDDEVLIIFSCRCIDAWWQSGGVQKAMERRMHDLSDAIAIPAPYSQPEAQEHQGGFSNNSIILRDNEKQNYLEFVDDGNVNVLHQKDLDWDTLGNADIYVKGNVKILVDGNVTAHIKGTLDSTVDGDVTLLANANVTSNIKGTLTSTVDGDVTLTAKANVTSQIDGTLNSTVKGDITLTAQANVNATVTGNTTLECQGNIDAKASGNVAIEAQQVSIKAQQVTIDAPQTTISGNVSIGGNISGGQGGGGGNAQFTGTIQAQGNVTSQSDVQAGGVSLKGHRHSGVEPGSGTTGGPM